MLKRIIALAMLAGVCYAQNQQTGSAVSDADAEQIVLLSLSQQMTGTPTPDVLAAQAARVARVGLNATDSATLTAQANHFYNLHANNMMLFDAGTITFAQFLANNTTNLNSAMSAIQSGTSGVGYGAFGTFVQNEKAHMATATSASGGTYHAYYENVPDFPNIQTGSGDYSDTQIQDMEAEEPDQTCSVKETGTTVFDGGNVWNAGLGYVVNPGVGNPLQISTQNDGQVYVLDSLKQIWSYQSVLGNFTTLAGDDKTTSVLAAGTAPNLYRINTSGIFQSYNFGTSKWATVTGAGAGSYMTQLAAAPSNRGAGATHDASGSYSVWINSNLGTAAWQKVGQFTVPVVSVAVGTGGTTYANGAVYFFLFANGNLYSYTSADGLAVVSVSGITGTLTQISASDDHTVAVLTTNSSGNIFKGNTPVSPKNQGLSLVQVPGYLDSLSSDSVSDLYGINHSNNTVYQYLPNSVGTTYGLIEGNTGRVLLNQQNNVVTNMPFGDPNGDNNKGAGGLAKIVTTCGAVVSVVVDILFDMQINGAKTKSQWTGVATGPLTGGDMVCNVTEWCLPATAPPLCDTTQVTQEPLIAGGEGVCQGYYWSSYATLREKVGGDWKPWECEGKASVLGTLGNNAVSTASPSLGGCTGPRAVWDSMP